MTTNALQTHVHALIYTHIQVQSRYAAIEVVDGCCLRRNLPRLRMRGREKGPSDTERVCNCKGICKTYLFCCETLQHTRPSLPPNLASRLARKTPPLRSQSRCRIQQRPQVAEKKTPFGHICPSKRGQVRQRRGKFRRSLLAQPRG